MVSAPIEVCSENSLSPPGNKSHNNFTAMRGAALRCGARPGAAVPGSALLGKGEEYLRKGMDFHVCSTGKSS